MYLNFRKTRIYAIVILLLTGLCVLFDLFMSSPGSKVDVSVSSDNPISREGDIQMHLAENRLKEAIERYELGIELFEKHLKVVRTNWNSYQKLSPEVIMLGGAMSMPSDVDYLGYKYQLLTYKDDLISAIIQFESEMLMIKKQMQKQYSIRLENVNIATPFKEMVDHAKALCSQHDSRLADLINSHERSLPVGDCRFQDLVWMYFFQSSE